RWRQESATAKATRRRRRNDARSSRRDRIRVPRPQRLPECARRKLRLSADAIEKGFETAEEFRSPLAHSPRFKVTSIESLCHKWMCTRKCQRRNLLYRVETFATEEHA